MSLYTVSFIGCLLSFMVLIGSRLDDPNGGAPAMVAKLVALWKEETLGKLRRAACDAHLRESFRTLE